MSSAEPSEALPSVDQLILGKPDKKGKKKVPAPKSKVVPAADDENDEHTKSDDVVVPAPKELKPLTPEQTQKIATQVTFYFSDANLPTDNFLLKKVKANEEGWVDIKVICSFNRMKQLLKKHEPISTVATIVTDLCSNQLLIDETKTKIRRVAPLSEFDLEDLQARTVVAENLGPEPTIDGVIERFTLQVLAEEKSNEDDSEGPSKDDSKITTTIAPAMIRVRHPGMQTPAGVTSENTGLDLVHVASGATHALVEYSSRELAELAVHQKNDDKDWRNGLRVRLLVKNLHLAKKKNEQKERAKKEREKEKEAKGGEGDETKDDGDDETGDKTDPPSDEAGLPVEESPSKPSKSKKIKYKKGKRDYSQWASASAFKENKMSFLDGEGGAVGGEGGEATEKSDGKTTPAIEPNDSVPKQPSMPDGTKGFACATKTKKRTFPKGVLTTPFVIAEDERLETSETNATGD